MKSKKILISFLSNGNINSQIVKRLMFDRTIDDMIAEGRVLDSKTQNIAYFEDGTKITLKPFSSDSNPEKYTHMYFDLSVKYFPNGANFINELVKYSLINEEKLSFDTSGKQCHFFSLVDGSLILT